MISSSIIKLVACLIVWSLIFNAQWAISQDTSIATSPATVSPQQSVEGEAAQTTNDDVESTVEEEGEGYEVLESPELDNEQTIDIAEDWKRLGKNQIWINHATKQVMVRGRICLRVGGLEMFACPGNSKSHESVIAAEAKSSEIHACFVALGFDPGKPVQWDPKYTTATGPSIDVLVKWMSGEFLKEANAKTMVRVSGTDKTLENDWVFGGSQEFTDNVTGDKIYYADSGEMICLSNFSTAMMDVPIRSSDAADGLLFEANTETIPPVNTQVYMVLTPKNSETEAAEDPQTKKE